MDQGSPDVTSTGTRWPHENDKELDYRNILLFACILVEVEIGYYLSPTKYGTSERYNTPTRLRSRLNCLQNIQPS